MLSNFELTRKQVDAWQEAKSRICQQLIPARSIASRSLYAAANGIARQANEKPKPEAQGSLLKSLGLTH
jgi:hypothetical protein